MIDSSPPLPSSSAESSFRELDEVFLQTQTRIWLGEILNTRLDEDLPLPDLLQDGEILFQVSKVVWDLLMTKCMELRHLKHKYGPFGSKKSSGRYRPYSNVDSFLKICKILGLSGIDLFSPSDVVEKRNIRKVCICLRALSKKTKSKQLSALDFDMVIYSVTMPTDMVGVIRRSLESPQCTVSSSSSYSSHKGSKVKLKQKNLHAPDNRDDDSSSSDESDEAESRYMGENSFSSPCNFDNADGVNLDLEDSPEKYLVESDDNCQCTEKFKHRQCKSASDFDKASSCYSISKKRSYHGISHVNSEERQTYSNGDEDVSNMNFTLENDDPFMGDSSSINMGENNYIANYLAFSDLMVHATEGSSNSVVLDGEKNMFDFFLNVEPQGDTMDERSFHKGSQRILSDDEDIEVSSTTSMSSVLGRLLNLEFDNRFDEDDSSSTNVDSSVSNELESKKLNTDSSVLSEPPKEDTFKTQLFHLQESGSKMVTRVLSSAEYCFPSQETVEMSIEECSKDETCDSETTSQPREDFCLESRGMVVANDDTERPLSREEERGTETTSQPGEDFCLDSRGVVVAYDDLERPLSCEEEDKEINETIILGSDADMIQQVISDNLEFENDSESVGDKERFSGQVGGQPGEDFCLESRGMVVANDDTERPLSREEERGTETTSQPGEDFCLESRGVVVANDDPERPLSCEEEDKEMDETIVLGSDADMIQQVISDNLEFEHGSKSVGDKERFSGQVGGQPGEDFCLESRGMVVANDDTERPLSREEERGTETTSQPGEDFCLESRGVVVANDDPERLLSCEEEDKEFDETIVFGSDADMIQQVISDNLEFEHDSKSVGDKERFSGQVENVGGQATNIHDAAPPHLVSDDTNTCDSILQPNPGERVSENTLCEPVKDMNAAEEPIQNNISSADENGGQDKTEKILHSSKDGSDSQPPSKKHNRKPLLITVVRGTAIAGVIFFLLQIRKSNGNSTQERQQNAQYNRPKPLSGKEQTRSVGKGMYPTEKIKLGN